ncbi:MAG: hypothetical protein WC866_04610 [Patescibacteria group bacterium]|jgi:hypothetical protein
MSKFIPAIVAIMLFTTGCAIALSNAERAELEKLRSADQAARVERAKKDGYRPPGAPEMPATSAKSPDVSGSSNAFGPVGQPGMFGQNGNAATSEVVLGQRSAYVCVTGSQSRQVRKGRLLKLVNNYCDGDRDGGLNCADNDYDGFPDNESFLAFEIDGKPVATDTQGVLMPNQTCYVDVGRARQVKLTVMRFANIGTHRAPRIDPNTVDASYVQPLGVEGNVTLYDVTEIRHWSAR